LRHPVDRDALAVAAARNDEAAVRAIKKEVQTEEWRDTRSGVLGRTRRGLRGYAHPLEAAPHAKAASPKEGGP